jgi:hypothetical protein
MNGHPPLRYLTDLDDDGKSGHRSVDTITMVPGRSIFMRQDTRLGARPALIAIAIIITFAAGAVIGHSIGIQHGKAVAQVKP